MDGDERAEGATRRRLSDRIEDAFDLACLQGEVDIASCMLKALDLCLLGRPMDWERRQLAVGVLRGCQARLEELRQAQAAEERALSAHNSVQAVIEPNSASPAYWAALPRDTNCHTGP
jgi:hypothetical protein